jgi:D-glycerate 3-kinase
MADDLHTALQWLARHTESVPPIPEPVLHSLARDLIQDDGAFGSQPDQAMQVAGDRARQFMVLYPELNRRCQQTLGWSSCPVNLLWRLWLPLAAALTSTQQALGRPMIQGILGLQGTGKTTLARILGWILQQWGLTVCQLSIDDLYKTHAERQQLRQADPRLRWRGPPGTHDVELGFRVLQQLKAGTGEPVTVPRFDKSAYGGEGDRTTPEPVAGVDITLFEGWFVGLRPIDPACFDQAPPPIVTDRDRQFARDMNVRLAEYLPLWDLLDRLIVLHPVDYHLSLAWRQQAEQDMKRQGKAGLSDPEIEQFVEYFWRSLHPQLFLPPLLGDSQYIELVIEIQADHSPGKIYWNSES